MYDIIIIGAGPAGLTAAIYARRASKSVLVLEALTYGGQIINTPSIANYPAAPDISGFEFATKVYEQAEALGAEFVYEKAADIQRSENGASFFVKTDENEYEGKAVIIAAGSVNRKLGLPNEEELVGRGVSYCATCDGAFYRGKRTAVAGGGNTALEDALYLADLAEKVYIVHRRDAFRGEETTVNALKQRPNVEFVLNSSVTKLCADKKLTGIEVTDKNTGETRELAVDGLFVAIGRVPSDIGFNVGTRDSGYIDAGEDCRTNVPGIFAAGDCREKEVRQLVTAAADGAVAATEAVRYIASLR
ncbi:MAG: thioredoxin-disulfide reductase [Ruminiclostridium sp.]|nr:thioredoxin-disulfide reductase [Ruminiclostridium sp.]